MKMDVSSVGITSDVRKYLMYVLKGNLTFRGLRARHRCENVV